MSPKKMLITHIFLVLLSLTILVFNYFHSDQTRDIGDINKDISEINQDFDKYIDNYLDKLEILFREQEKEREK